MYYPKLIEVKKHISFYSDFIFRGEILLDELDVELKPSELEWGWCQPKLNGDILFGVNSEFDSYPRFIKTILHEMIHCCQVVNGANVNHTNKIWKHWTYTIKDKLSLEIPTRAAASIPQ